MCTTNQKMVHREKPKNSELHTLNLSLCWLGFSADNPENEHGAAGRRAIHLSLPW